MGGLGFVRLAAGRIHDGPRFPEPELLTNTAELAALCARLRSESFVAIDTEFIRERTYWPELCVVQLAGADEVAIVDARSPELDLTPLGELLADAAVTKVFHAARQDIEIFFLRFGDVPRPVFDTQIAAMVAGFGEQVGYDTLVAALAGQQIEKVQRFSDWAARPLSAAQIAYAAADVTHLRTVYQSLLGELERKGRLGWIAEEMAAVADPNTYRVDPESMWKRLRYRSSNRRFLGQLRAIAAWRERQAQLSNVPRQRLLKDESLVELAAMAPQTSQELLRVRGVTKGFAEGRAGESLLAAIAEAKRLPTDALPEIDRSGERARPSAALVALLRVLLATQSEQHHVAPRLLASGDDIDRLATEDMPAIQAMHGWRWEVFGRHAVALKRGEIGMSVERGRISLIELPLQRPQRQPQPAKQ